MSEDSDAVDGAAVDPEAFDEWLSHTAESKDVSKSELMNQMVTSYWILDELNRLNDPADDDVVSPPHPAEGASDRENRADNTSSTPDTSPEDRPADGGQTESQFQELKEELRSLRSAIQADSDRHDRQSASANAQRASDLLVAIPTLQRQIENLADDVDDQQSSQDAYADRISNELTRINGRIEEIDSETDRLESEKADTERIESLERELTAELQSAIERFDAKHRQLESTDEKLESWIDEEFDSIEAVLERLLTTVDGIDDRIEAIEENHSTALEELRGDDLARIEHKLDERERLAQLKKTAMRSGVRGGVCESCDGAIELPMLESPSCPHCESRFVGIDDGGWNPFKKARIETEPTTPPSTKTSSDSAPEFDPSRE